MDPKVLLLDEPLGSLDAHLRVRMQSELRLLQQELGHHVRVRDAQPVGGARHGRSDHRHGSRARSSRRARRRRCTGGRRTASWPSSSAPTTSSRAPSRRWRRAGSRSPPRSASSRCTPPTACPRSARRPRFVIAADRITTAAEGDLLENRLHGRLRGEEFVGAVATLFLELDGRHRVSHPEAGAPAHPSCRPRSATASTRRGTPTAAYLLPNP